MTQRCDRLIYLTFFMLLVRSVTAQTLQVIDAEGHATILSAAQVAGAPHVKVTVRDHDADASFEGVALSDLFSLRWHSTRQHDAWTASH